MTPQPHLRTRHHLEPDTTPTAPPPSPCRTGPAIFAYAVHTDPTQKRSELPVYVEQGVYGAPQHVRDAMQRALSATTDGHGSECVALTGADRRWLRIHMPIHEIMRGVTNRGFVKLAGTCSLPIRQCAICITRDNEPNPDHVIWVTLPCQHRFHVYCIARWSRCNPQCAMCRAASGTVYWTEN
jgi:hypothetical protein